MRVRKVTLLRGALTIGLSLAVAVGGGMVALGHSKKTHTTEGAATQTNTAADAGVSFVPQTPPANASNAEAQAIGVARDAVGSVADAAGVQVSVAYGLFTDSEYTTVLPSGQPTPLYVDQLVWLVTFSGVDLAPTVFGPSDNHEINVVVGAATGQYLEAYSFQ